MMMKEIQEIKGREVLDSRGNPTVEVEVVLRHGITGRASPSEAWAFIDGCHSRTMRGKDLV